MGDQGKCRSQKKLKWLIEIPYVVHVKVHVLYRVVHRKHESTGSNLQHEPYLFSVGCSQTKLSISVKIWVSGKGSFAERAKNVDRGSLCSALESIGSKLQYEPYLFSVAISQTRLSISVKVCEIR